ncbi:MAG: hypothetical protein JSS84_05650 [Bacteroidetes bacterium]|nr:hypothetical protein [Bacteroidota bacterium]
MKAVRILFLGLALLFITIVVAGPDTTRTCFEQAYSELQDMLEGNRVMSFERAVYISEAAYLDDTIGYDNFRSTLDAYQYFIGQLAKANDGSDTMDFRVPVPRAGRLDIRTLKHTEGEKRAFYHNVLHNWAIFAFLTDTTRFGGFEHLPLGYQYADPFGMKDWRHSQVTNLLFGQERKGNCFALVALYKILADRLHSGAYICTAPQHIYIQHQDHKGDWYNVELATGTHPGDGSIKTLTYTWNEGITSGIALRRLKEERQNIALCLVNLGMGHQHKFAVQGDAFALQCADLALKHDPKNLNAMLLRQQVLEERVAVYAEEKNLTTVEQMRKTPAFSQLEEQVVQLNALGYHPMPRYMQEIILAELEHSDRGPYITKNRTPDPFPSLNVAPKDKRYSTLSLGRFEEVHVQKRYEVYGSVTLDTREKRITEFRPDMREELLIDPVAFAWSIDPLAAKYPQWSPYAFSGNRVIDGVELEGAEWSRIPNANSNGAQFAVKLKVINSSGASDKNVMDMLSKMGPEVNSALSINTDKYKYSTKVQFELVSEIKPATDFYIEMVDAPPGETVKLGSTKLGESQINRIALVGSVGGEDVTNNETWSPYLTRALAHELGHTAGVDHPDGDRATELVKKAYKAGIMDNNLMIHDIKLKDGYNQTNARNVAVDQFETMDKTVEKQEPK